MVTWTFAGRVGQQAVSLHRCSPRSRQIPSKAPSHRPMRRLRRWVAPCTWRSRWSRVNKMSRKYHREPNFLRFEVGYELQLHAGSFQCRKTIECWCSMHSWMDSSLDLRLLEPKQTPKGRSARISYFIAGESVWDNRRMLQEFTPNFQIWPSQLWPEN